MRHIAHVLCVPQVKKKNMALMDALELVVCVEW